MFANKTFQNILPPIHSIFRLLIILSLNDCTEDMCCGSGLGAPVNRSLTKAFEWQPNDRLSTSTEKGENLPVPISMSEIYRSVSDPYGNQKGAIPYNADMVIGLLTKDSSQNGCLHFSLEKLPTDHKMLSSELHLYRMFPKQAENSFRKKFIYLSLYEIRTGCCFVSKNQRRLVDVRRISSQWTGWIVFHTGSLHRIPSIHDNSLDMLIIPRYGDGSLVPNALVQFALNQPTGQSGFQPCLLLFLMQTDRNPHQKDNSIFSPKRANIPDTQLQLSPTSAPSEPLRTGKKTVLRHSKKLIRHRRTADLRSIRKKPRSSPSSPNRNMCSRRSMMVDFAQLGWNQWIISPTRYDAHMCVGKCPFPLGQAFYPTNHAVVQMLMHQLSSQNQPPIARPCCVPKKLSPLNVLYYDEQSRVVLKAYDDMVVETCGCG
ncbi:unnamed protein product [Calicophoron daubneyi]|uniref:TGF-beta family profile domain-containing protein n=1 Tax=Calicophoron daubneyi TaxID=300641 RepID=A0AAV2TNL3_CALDB